MKCYSFADTRNHTQKWICNQPWHCVIINLLCVDTIHYWLAIQRSICADKINCGEARKKASLVRQAHALTFTFTRERIERTRNVTSHALSHIVCIRRRRCLQSQLRNNNFFMIPQIESEKNEIIHSRVLGVRGDKNRRLICTLAPNANTLAMKTLPMELSWTN